MSKKPTFHSRTKRIYILYHIIRRLVSNGEITERWRMHTVGDPMSSDYTAAKYSRYDVPKTYACAFTNMTR